MGQRKDQRATIYVVRCPGADQDDSDVEVSVELMSKSDDQSEVLSNTDLKNLADDIVSQVKSSATQTPLVDPDPVVNSDDNGSDIDCADDDIESEIEETNDNASAVLDKIKHSFKPRNRDSDSAKKQFYACKYCDKLYGRKSDCLRHEKRSAKTKMCVKTEQDETAGVEKSNEGPADIILKGHGTIVREVPPKTTNPSVHSYYHCPHCEKKLKGSSNFYNHIRVVHEKYKPHTCDVCGKKFGTKTNHANHQIAVHTRKCDSCGSYVAETEPWAEGVTKHTERNILCGNCNKVVLFYSGTKFPTTSGLSQFRERPKKLEQEKQTYACEICDKLFNKLYDCKRHQQKHADGNYNMCDVCGRQFKHSTSLQQHKKIHEETFVPYSCWVCDKKFELKSSFTQHINKIHGLEYKNKDETAESTVQVVIDETVDPMGNAVLTF